MNGLRMRDLRQKAGLLQIEVAPELGVNNDTICRWESRNHELARAYAEAFERLVNDVERVHWIRSSRRARRRGNRTKNISGV